MEPFLESVLEDYADIQLLKIDVQEEPATAVEFGVRNVPHLIFLESGEEKGRLSGGHPARKLREFIEECLSR
jgi:thioredoxin 1